MSIWNTINFEIHCTDFCTRSCKFCHHFVPYAEAFNLAKEYIAEEYFPFIDKLVSIGRKPDIVTVIGGEPFIHSDLNGFILGIKKRYNVKIAVVTNGFWLADIDNHLSSLENIDILGISIYPDNNINNVDQFVGRLKSKFPNLEVRKSNVEKMIVVSFVSDPFINQKNCGCLNCMGLRPDGKLYRCSLAGYAEWSPNVTKEFLEERKEMVLDLTKDENDIKAWADRDDFSVCMYCTYPRDVRVDTVSDPSFFLNLGKKEDV